MLILTACSHSSNEVIVYCTVDQVFSEPILRDFEKETGIKVTITDYDSNDTALAKIKAGGHGFDIVVPSGTSRLSPSTACSSLGLPNMPCRTE